MSIANFLAPDSWLKSDGGPRYMQLRRRVSDGVKQGVLKPGSPLPPEREIAAITETSRVTVRKAFQALAEDGIIVQKQGHGSFIASNTPQLEQSLSRLTSFSEDMSRRGMTSTSVWLERGIFMPSPDEVLALALTPDASVSRIARLRTADDKPMAIERASLSTEMLPNPLEVETSLYEVLERSGLRPHRALQKISAINLQEEDANLLDIPAGAAGLRIERTSYLRDGRVVEFTQSIYRGDAYNFVAELRLAKE
ncbi:GntR family transcriptional regulator [Sulfitobacter sp. M57]|uniref:GntR family transcriptional regulator n=1 Tax=unclassified Sulfitobacter TaxID=196795 RepID=UPI0023E2B5AF|nr:MULTISPECIES: GntR family transcriptional regulator [unclassified Sulfitobacter]MDF3415470.1 GntR family transcriptional regulator [Sulfitobacter sp. KE5]MDF3422951.1 GntR family transcriptional regulator [Sulfitobacter sp. KE43]MDF3434016.1 GntR family transcriptional regulator [Sulfitobacter sp. KE42]MDF3459951.1 GntR family transcriptional regulator [Sulfitobacter sp. S74]MDF3463555.1 GntR family transcriptional regulator [Sulfitobacter sp. Ks18]